LKIGYRTLKTAIAAPIAIFIAQLLHLENYISAGILTILCIKVTRKKSVLHAWYRFAACIIAIVLSSIIFEIVGYHPISICLLLLLFIPITVQLKISEGIVTSSVIILHVYGSGHVTIDLIKNEVILIIVGLGMALIVNLYMPSLEKDLRKLQQKVEDNFGKILKEMAHYLHIGDERWTGKEFPETKELLERAKALAYRDVENHLLRSHHPYYYYFQMRTKQFEILERMLALISRLEGVNKHSQHIAEFLDQLAEGIHPGNTAIIHLNKLKDIRKKFQKESLPKTREEFEARANLFSLLHEIEQYLMLKRNFKKSDI
jgi:uncharacterized membrane protein YgaE (UPF0421/DUF939 family)